MSDPVTVSISMGALLFIGLAALGAYGIMKATQVKERLEIEKTIDEKGREAYQMSKLKALEKTVDKLETKGAGIRT
ncbi:MAG TPA: hypothetical protein EYH22_02985 [Candidatus Nanopusillus sp.]|nr:hypothetical protein [Candidatus Nanopusillus sp.]